MDGITGTVPTSSSLYDLKSVLDSIAIHVTNIKGSDADVATLKDIVNAITSNAGGNTGGA